MNIDLYTIQLAMSTVIIVSGVMFILDAFLRKTDAAGRIWAVSFMAAILAAFAYAAWTVVPGAWWAISIGNAAIVLTPGLLWSGARAYNGRGDLAWVGAIGSFVAGVAVLIDGPDGGDWAGAGIMFALIAAFAGLGAMETLRPPMRQNWTARGLTVIFIVVALFYAVRTVVFLVRGPEDQVFSTFLGTEAAAFVLISLVVVTLASLLLLQSERVPRTLGRQGMAVSYTDDAVLNGASFREIVDDWLERANFHDEQLVFIRVELDGLDALNTAFGRSVGTQLLGEFTAAVRRYSSPHSDIGSVGRGALVVVAPYVLLEHATADAEAVQDGLREHHIEAAQGIRLAASIGIAGTDRFGYDFGSLMSAAGAAASAARSAGGDTIVLAE